MSKILNRSATKKEILARFKSRRAGPPMKRVSKEYLDYLEAFLRNKIDADIDSHPSIGVTFKP